MDRDKLVLDVMSYRLACAQTATLAYAPKSIIRIPQVVALVSGLYGAEDYKLVLCKGLQNIHDISITPRGRWSSFIPIFAFAIFEG